MKSMVNIKTGFDLFHQAQGDEFVIVNIKNSKEQYVLSGGNMGVGTQHVVNRKLAHVYEVEDIIDVNISDITGFKCIKKSKIRQRK